MPIKNEFENITYPYTNERVFPIIMQDPDKCRALLERIFPGRKIRNLKLHGKPIDCSSTPEKTVIASVKGHGVRFDVLFEDVDAWYDIELQVTDHKDINKRSRYYHSMMDSEYLKKGKKYLSLNTHYVIFICTFDPMGYGLPMYRFMMYDGKNNLPLGDESYTIILNTSARRVNIPNELLSYFDYINSIDIDKNDPFIRDIHQKVLDLNSSVEWRDALMTWDEMLEEKYDEGIEQGKAEGAVLTLAKLVKDGTISLEIALNKANDPDKLNELLNKSDI